MRSYSLILFLFILKILCLAVLAETEVFYVSPLCTKQGLITCPIGFEAACADEIIETTVPKCLFYENKYIPGCWKFIGVKKLDFALIPVGLPPGAMFEITGGGETYTLNREIVGCRKL